MEVEYGLDMITQDMLYCLIVLANMSANSHFFS